MNDSTNILIGVGVIILLAVLVGYVILNSNQSDNNQIPCTNSQFGFCSTNPNLQVQTICYKQSDGTEKCIPAIPISQ